MNERKAAEVLKKVFSQCGPEIIRDGRRFDAYLMDLLGRKSYRAENMVLRRAADSDALFPLVNATAITSELVEWTIERLKTKSRLTAEDAVFVTRCAVIALDGSTEVIPQPIPPGGSAPGWLRKYLIPLLSVVVAAVVGMLALYCHSAIDHYQDLCQAEAVQRERAERDLAAVNAALAETQDAQAGTLAELHAAQSEAQELESSLAELEEKLKEAQALAANTETELRAVRTELYKVGRREYGFISSDFYADRGAVVLNSGESETLYVYGGYGYPTTYSMRVSSVSGLKAEWNEKWEGNTIGAVITAELPGYYTIHFSNSRNSEEFDVLIIVLDAQAAQ